MNPDQGASAHLAVVVLHARDAEAAARGGADRLLLALDPVGGPWSPEPSVVSAVVRETDLPVWVTLRSPDEPFHRVVQRGLQYAELGAAGLVYGFLDRDLEIDRPGCAEMCAETQGAPWMFLGVDEALESTRAWRDVLTLPGLESVVTAGSTRGLTHGADDLIEAISSQPRVAELAMAGGGLSPDLVPWLVRAGVRKFAVGGSVRPGGSWTRSSVAVDHVRTWRMLLDDALSRALGIPVD